MKYTQSKLKAEISFPELVSICPLKFKKTEENNKPEWNIIIIIDKIINKIILFWKN